MVSFQCDACSDVVKKPKLDKHRQMCNSSFTCIDCSTTFQGPAEYKGHTQCMTEAEKYQKGLYKGPKGKANDPRNNKPQARNDYTNTPSTGTYQSQNPRFNAPGGNRPSWSRGPTRWEATGANVTPLGTPLRMSPFTSVDPETSSPKEAPVVGKEKDATAVKSTEDKQEKRKNGADRNGTNGQANGEPPKKKTKTDDTTTLSVPSSSPAKPTNPSSSAEKKEKKNSKRAKDDKEAEPAVDVSLSTDKKEKKKNKKGKEVAEVESAKEEYAETKKAKKNKKGAETSVSEDASVNGAESAGKDKKSKKRQRAEGDGVPIVGDAEESLNIEGKKKDGKELKPEKKMERKHKKSKSIDVEAS